MPGVVSKTSTVRYRRAWGRSDPEVLAAGADSRSIVGWALHPDQLLGLDGRRAGVL
jgi:hypothetical protein